MSDNHDPRAERAPATTTDAGIPAASDEQSLTVGPSGPILLPWTKATDGCSDAITV